MFYYTTAVGDPSYHGSELLTYSSRTSLRPGTLVHIALRQKRVLGIIIDRARKPAFPTKEALCVSGLPCIPEHSLALMQWMQTYYPAARGAIAQLFLPKHSPEIAPRPNPAPKPFTPPLPPLTDDQQYVLSRIQKHGLHMLHGETGTGKTRVYIELAQRAIEENKSVIILTPEIGLTSQLATEFRQVLGDNVVVLHSQLTEKKRRDIWTSLLSENRPWVIIGARSAIFSPVNKIGLIIVDESHETAYKQDQSPYYNANRVASKLAEITSACIVFGSATPLVADYFFIKAKGRPILRMTQTAAKGQLASSRTDLTIVDLRDRPKFSISSHLSNELIEAIRTALSCNEQSLVYLNRRGTARVVFCEKCGWQSSCPRCDLPLVYHGDQHRMLCHSCSYKTQVVTHCPVCANTDIIFRSIGTKAISDELGRLFPEAKIMRFDTDNKKLERIEHHYENIRKGETDIIVGTQTLAKGLDLPKLSVVGVVNADTSLYFPDFSSRERTYQLLSQVLGRVGRGHRSSKVIIQTYLPDSALINAVVQRDWEAFYNSELEERKQFMFPPYCHLLKLTCKRASDSAAKKATEQFKKELESRALSVSIEGPSPAFHQRVRNEYRWQLIIKARLRDDLIKVIRVLPANWTYDIDPLNLL